MSDYRTTEDGDMVGPKMDRAVRSVERKGYYPSKNKLAIDVGPHGSQDYGYRIVDRCVVKGLLELAPDHPDATPQGAGAVIVTDKGKKYLDNASEE